MDIQKMLAELRETRQMLDEAIASLERLLQGRGKRRGRPPSWMTTKTGGASSKRRVRTPGSKNTAETEAA